VVITDNLSWSSHIESTCLKAKKQLGLIHRHYHQAPRVAHERLYKLTVLPHLDYCASVWDLHQAKYKEKLNSVQAFASKVVLQSWTTPRQQRLSMLKWPCLEDRRKVQKLIMCHKIINGRSCIPSSTFSQHPYPSLRHSHSLPLFVPQSHSVSHRSSFLYLLFLCGTLCPQLFHLHLQLLPLSPMLLLICIKYVSLYLLFFCFWGSP